MRDDEQLMGSSICEYFGIRVLMKSHITNTEELNSWLATLHTMHDMLVKEVPVPLFPGLL
jgi:hypothetical protein